MNYSFSKIKNVTITFIITLLFSPLVNTQNIQQNKNENNNISLIECYSNLNNAFKIIASPNQQYIFVLQKNIPKGISKLVVLKKELYLKKLLTIETPNILDIAIGKDNKTIFLLSNSGSILKYHFSKSKKKLSLIHKSVLSNTKNLFTKGLIIISENEKFLYCSTQNKTQSFLKAYSVHDNSINEIQAINGKRHDILEGLLYLTIEDNYLFAYSFHHVNIGVFKINTNGILQFQKFSSYQGFYNAMVNLSTSKKILYLTHVAVQQYQIKSPLLVLKNGSLTPLSKINASSSSFRFAYPYKNNDNIISINKDKINIKTINPDNTSSIVTVNTTKELQEGIKDLIILNNKIYILNANNLCVYDIDSKPKIETIKPTLSKKPIVQTEENTEVNNTINSDELIQAIRKHDGNKILKSIASGVNVNYPDIYDATSLMWAFYFSQVDVIKLLLSKGATTESIGGIYQDRNFENYYGNILSIAIERDFELLRYAIEELKIPWNDQQYDIFTNQKSGHTALSSLLLKKLNFQLQINDPELQTDLLNKSGYQFQSHDISDIIDQELERMKLSENDLIACEYIISKIQNRTEKKIYKNLLNYKKRKDITILNKIISDLKSIDIPYLKILLVDLMALSLEEQSEIKTYENVLDLSKKYYGTFHPKTITHTFNLAISCIYNSSFQNKKLLLDRAEKLLWQCLRNRITRYGLYHSLTGRVLNELARIEFLKNGNNSNEYSILASKISDKLTNVSYGGINYNQYGAYGYQTLERAGVNLNDFALHANYYNNRFKSGFDRIKSFFPSLQFQSWSQSGIQKKYFDVNFMINYINQNFDLLKDKFISKDSTVYISEITHAYNAIYSYRENAITEGYYQNSLQELDAKLFNLQLRIKGMNLLPKKKKMEFMDLQKTLTEQEAIVEIIRFNNFIFSENSDIEYNSNHTDEFNIKYIAYILTKESPNPVMIPLLINGKDEKNFTKALFSNGSNQKPIINFMHKERENLYNKIWAPLEPYLKEKTQIYLSPDGLFHQFPFDLLENDNNKITENIEIIRVINSSNVVKLKKHTENYKNNKIKPNAVLIGNPDFNLSGKCITTSRNKTPPLPETIKEIDFISTLLKNKKWEVSSLTGKHAKENVLKQISSPTILHIATHGNYRKKNIKTPFESFVNHYLKLSGCDCDQQNKNNDGLLDGKEAQLIDLKDTQLVVLSACETGIGSSINAEGIIGISKAFQIAGAKSIISTLWKVNSEITVEFMKYFYGKFSETNNKFRAFKYAKEKLKTSWGSDFSAGYIMIN
ncbi:CHAT domain-containing protein [Flavivirga abyssicola]|uniref:CHAT domain-containing protein n=1 Tax=Flavivirga abyssicola TaxID=3063533 RepID=UPI0026DF4D5A|nr:CHAT domain-containing protein [Flavivirga sp. MEBiC07777]WVK14228.1 CHAT domain-containing protein [Flavivirga sp. MEBiC07777]